MDMKSENILPHIDNWADKNSKLSTDMDYDSFMSLNIEFGNNILLCLMVICNMIPQYEDVFKGYTRSESFVAGLLAKTFKLYDAIIYHSSAKQSSNVNLFMRPLIESTETLKYLIQNPDKVIDCQKSSFMPAVRNYKFLMDIKRERELTDLESRMVYKIKNNVSSDGFDIDELVTYNSKVWNGLKPNLKELHRRVKGSADMYDFLHGNLSGFIHSDWQDIKFNHILIENENLDTYFPYLKHSPINKQIIPLITLPVMDCLLDYISWKNFDPAGSVKSLLEKLFSINQQLVVFSEEKGL